MKAFIPVQMRLGCIHNFGRGPGLSGRFFDPTLRLSTFFLTYFFVELSRFHAALRH